MTSVVSNDEAGERELMELSSRLRDVAEAMRSLSGDQGDVGQRLQELKDEVASVCFHLRSFSRRLYH